MCRISPFQNTKAFEKSSRKAMEFSKLWSAFQEIFSQPPRTGTVRASSIGLVQSL